MLNGRKLVLDTLCEVYDLLKPWTDDEFWDLENHAVIPNSIYLIGRQQCKTNVDKVRQMAESGTCLPILSNPHEGSDTLRWQVRMLGLEDLVLQKKMLLIGGGDMESCYSNLRYDTFLVKIMEHVRNQENIKRTDEIFAKPDKPYKFLFLNGVARPHRKYLIEKLRLTGILDQGLWTCLDSKGFNHRSVSLVHQGENLMVRPIEIKYLPKEYEVQEFQQRISIPPDVSSTFVKFHLFDGKWGEIYLQPEQYIDTYFSIVTETIFDYPYSFRTEKIAKPLAMGHPWIAVTNAGYYRDIRNLGFRTFGHLIDESFDVIDNHQARVDRIAKVVDDLCRQDLRSFLAAAKETCKYNQQHLLEIIPKIRQEFPDRFFNFVQENLQ